MEPKAGKAVTETVRQNAQMFAIRHGMPAYIHRRLDNGEIVICLVEKSETWLDRAPLELLEVVQP